MNSVDTAYVFSFSRVSPDDFSSYMSVYLISRSWQKNLKLRASGRRLVRKSLWWN